MEGGKGLELVAEKGSRFRRICVFCGSQCGKKSSYQEAAVELGKELVRSHCLNQVASFFGSFQLFFFLMDSKGFTRTTTRYLSKSQ